jgi:TP901 family phage tail tape measure protein
MSTAKQRLLYEVRLKDLASQALRNIGETAEKQTSRARKAFRGLGKAIKLVGTAVVAAFTAAAFKGLFDGVKRAREFSAAMGEVSTILGEGSLSIGEASDKVKDLALSLGVPAPEVAAGMYQTLSAGVTDSAQAMTLLEGATKLGISGLATTKESVDLLTTAFNAYGMTVTEDAVGSMSDMIFKTVQLGKTTIPELSASMGQVLPVASQLGISFDEVAAAVASLTLKGLSTSEATTQLNAVFTAFLKKGELAKKTFGEQSEVMGANAIRTKGLQLAMNDLMEAVGGSEDALIKLTGRAEGAKAIMALTADEGKVLTSQLEGIGQAAGAADQAFDKMSNTLDRRLSVMAEGATQGFAVLGTTILETMTGSGQSFEDATEQAETFKSVITSLEPLLNAVGLVVGTIATGVVALGTAVHGAVFLVQAAGNAMGLVSDETFKGQRAAFGDTLVAMTAAAETTGNFGRKMVGLKPKAMEATNALIDFNNKNKTSKAVVEEASEAVDGLGDSLKTTGSQIVEVAEAMSGPLLSSARAFSSARIEANDAYLARAKENEKILDMTMKDGFDKELARIEARSFFEQQEFANKKEAAAEALRAKLVEEEVDAEVIKKRVAEFSRAMNVQVERFNEARTIMEEREKEALRKSTEETEKEARKAERARLRVMKEMEPFFAAAFAGPVALGFQLATQAALDETARMAQAVKGKLGTELADAMGGGLGAISGFFEMSPVFNLENLRSQLEEAKEQVSAALEGGLITEQQSQEMLNMIMNVEQFKLKELEAAAATYEFKRSLEELGEVEAGVKLGLHNFTNSIPTMGEAMADVTEGALNNFASGLTDAFMAMADGSKSASEAFKQFAAQFIMQTAAMIVQALILQAIKTAIGGFADGGVAQGGASNITPLANGGVVSGGLGRALPMRGYATGGPIVSEPHLALIGEGKMNEAVVPLPDGRSIPVEMNGGGEANVSFNISAVDARGVDELLVERQDTIRNLIRSAMQEDRVFRSTFQRR